MTRSLTPRASRPASIAVPQETQDASRSLSQASRDLEVLTAAIIQGERQEARHALLRAYLRARRATRLLERACMSAGILIPQSPYKEDYL